MRKSQGGRKVPYDTILYALHDRTIWYKAPQDEPYVTSLQYHPHVGVIKSYGPATRLKDFMMDDIQRF